MRIAKSSAMDPDLSCHDLGLLDVEAALRAFDCHPWAERLRMAEMLDASGAMCIDPEVTFSIVGCHLTAKARTDGVFDVEVCVPRLRKVLGLFRGVKFYDLKGVGTKEVREAIRTFFTAEAKDQHERFGGKPALV